MLCASGQAQMNVPLHSLQIMGAQREAGAHRNQVIDIDQEVDLGQRSFLQQEGEQIHWRRNLLLALNAHSLVQLPEAREQWMLLDLLSRYPGPQLAQPLLL